MEFFWLGLWFVGASSSSIRSGFDTSPSCSKFHFEEKVLEKLVRLEHNMQILEEKTDAREKLNTAKLDEMKNIKKLTKTFVQSMQDAQIQDQTRFNKSYQELVKDLKTKVDNETYIYENQINTLLESFSSKIKVFTEAEKKRESVIEITQSKLDQMKKRFNSSYDQIVENIQVNSNKKLQEIISNIQTVVVTGCTNGAHTVSAGSLKFPDILTSMGVSDLTSFKSSGKFTCQVPGYYYITVTLISYDVNTKIEIMRNSVAIHWQFMTGYTKENSYWTPGATAMALELKSNDNVWIKLASSKAIYQSCLTIFKMN